MQTSTTSNVTIGFPPPQGWNCPACGSAHPPHVHTCPNKAASPVPYVPPPLPVDPFIQPYTPPFIPWWVPPNLGTGLLNIKDDGHYAIVLNNQSGYVGQQSH